MAKGTKVLKGVFKEMLDDYLQVTKQTLKKGAGEGAGKAGREAAGEALETAGRQIEVPFKANWTGPGAKTYRDEMARQLERQLKTFDGMTPKQIREQLQNAGERVGKEQKLARERFTQQMTKLQETKLTKMAMTDKAGFEKAMKEFDVTPTGNPIADAKALAAARTDGFMKTVHALHEPDLIAGGRDVIGRAGDWDSFGLGNVNSAIGSQWRNLKGDLITQLEGLPQDIPIRLTHGL